MLWGDVLAVAAIFCFALSLICFALSLKKAAAHRRHQRALAEAQQTLQAITLRPGEVLTTPVVNIQGGNWAWANPSPWGHILSVLRSYVPPTEDRPAAEHAIREVFAHLGLTSKPIAWRETPERPEGADIASKWATAALRLHLQVPPSEMASNYYVATSWTPPAEAICETLMLENLAQKWRGVDEAMVATFTAAQQAGALCLWISAETIHVCPWPVVKKREVHPPNMAAIRQGLHCEDGPAVAWPTVKWYFLNDVEVPDWLVLTPAHEISAAKVLEERNAEVRREIVRKIGVERLLKDLNATVLDKDGDYELLALDLLDGRNPRPYLKMKNPSVPGVYHVEGVPPRTATVKAALAWRNQTLIPPKVLT